MAKSELTRREEQWAMQVAEAEKKVLFAFSSSTPSLSFFAYVLVVSPGSRRDVVIARQGVRVGRRV